MISFLACRITRPGRAIRAKRTALRRLLTHCPKPLHRVRLKATPLGPPCGVGSEQPRREPARSQVTLQDAVDLLAFTASLPVPPDRLISRKVSVGHQPGDLVPGSAGQPHHGEGQFQLQFHSRQRLFAQRLPDSDEPVFRVLLAVGYPVWYEVHLRPLLTCLDPSGAQSACGACQSCSATSDTARLNSGVTLSPTANSITPKARLCPRRSTAATRADTQPRPTAASPCPPHKADAPTLRSTLAVADSQQVRCRPETPSTINSASPSRSSEADTPCTSCSCRAPAACASPPAWRHVQRGLSAGRTALYEAHHIGVHLQTPQRFVG